MHLELRTSRRCPYCLLLTLHTAIFLLVLCSADTFLLGLCKASVLFEIQPTVEVNHASCSFFITSSIRPSWRVILHLNIGATSTLMQCEILLLVYLTDLTLGWDNLMLECIAWRILFRIILQTVDINFNCATIAELWLNWF